jgi:hypothetical protein
MVAGVLIGLTLVWGLLLTTKVIPRKGMPAWLTDMHRMLGGLAVAFLGLHLVALFLDSYAHFAWSELFVPFQSAYRAGAVAWGLGRSGSCSWSRARRCSSDGCPAAPGGGCTTCRTRWPSWSRSTR